MKKVFIIIVILLLGGCFKSHLVEENDSNAEIYTRDVIFLDSDDKESIRLKYPIIVFIVEDSLSIDNSYVSFFEGTDQNDVNNINDVYSIRKARIISIVNADSVQLQDNVNIYEGLGYAEKTLIYEMYDGGYKNRVLEGKEYIAVAYKTIVDDKEVFLITAGGKDKSSISNPNEYSSIKYVISLMSNASNEQIKSVRTADEYKSDKKIVRTYLTYGYDEDTNKTYIETLDKQIYEVMGMVYFEE